tara:strand:+ start:56 stop:409 length:354 start_codon:yes stop_codon:yes gene_type:complete
MNFYENIYNVLPEEIANKILYEYKGLTHPTAIIINDYWDELDEEYNIYINIERIITNTNIDMEDGDIEIVTHSTYRETYQEYPRLYFPVDMDFIKTIIHEIYDEDNNIWEEYNEYLI